MRFWALEVSMQKWQELPKISSWAALLNSPISSSRAAPFVLAEAGTASTAGKLIDPDEVPEIIAAAMTPTFRLGGGR